MEQCQHEIKFVDFKNNNVNKYFKNLNIYSN